MAGVAMSELNTRSISREAVANGAAWFAVAVGGIVTTAILYRELGPATFGVWATVVALRAFALFLDSGLMFSAAGASARLDGDRSAARSDLRGSLELGVLSGAAVAAAAMALAWVPSAILGLEGDIAVTATVATALLGIEVGLALAASPLQGMARGIGRFDLVLTGAIVQTTVSVGLVLVLAAPLGLVGAALGLLVGRGIGVIPVLRGVAIDLGGLTGSRAAWPRIREAARFAAPLWMIGLGTQIGLGTDVPIVGWFFGAVAAGSYAIGAVVPAAAVSALYALVDATYPRIARQGPTTGPLIGRLMLTATGLAGIGFTVIGALAPQILTVWVGTVDPLAVDVLRIYSLTWALNVPTHILVLRSMAARKHRILVPVVFGEAIVSVVLSVALATNGISTGPAIATLVTLAVSNLIIIPLLTLPHAGVDGRTVVSRSITGFAIGMTIGLVIAAISTGLPVGSFGMLVFAGASTVAAAACFGFVTLIRPGVLPRLASVIRNGGVFVWFRQRREVAQARTRLAVIRVEDPVVWIPSQPPLVTIRIATYDRGAMVRDRAIASALDQTYRNIEVVVVGDHCDAVTEAAVRSVHDPRIRFENMAERGRYPADPRYRWMVAGSAPMNRALDLAAGEWVAPLDDDDEFLPDHVDVLLDACRSRGLELAYGVAEMEVEPGVWELRGSAPLREGEIVHAAVLFRHALGFIRHDIESWRLYEPADWNVWHRMRDAGVRVGFVDRVVTRHFLERRELR